MQRRHGLSRRKQQSAAWELTVLLLLALLGISLVNEPETESKAAGSMDGGASLAPAAFGARQGPDFADRAFALSVGEPEDEAEVKPPKRHAEARKD